MTNPSNNTPGETDQPGPSAALRYTRLLIALMLTTGVLVFGVFAIDELINNQPQTPPDLRQFGTADEERDLWAPVSGESFLSIGQADPTQFPPIRGREVTHPGEIEPYLATAPYGVEPHRLTNTGSLVVEQCYYRRPDGDAAAVIAYYGQQAESMGLRAVPNSGPDANNPRILLAAWSDGGRRLEIAAEQMPETPADPPLRPTSAVNWVVKYIYVTPTAAP